MANLKWITLLILIAVVTFVVALFTPQMHKQVIITEGKYVFVEENSTQSIPVKATVQDVTPTAVTVSNNNIQNVQNIKTTSTNINNVPVKTVQQTVKTTPVKNVSTKPVNKNVAVQPKTVTKTVTTTNTNNVKNVQQPVKTVPKPTVAQNNDSVEKWKVEQAKKKAEQEKAQKAKEEQQAKENAQKNSNYTAQRVLTEHEETVVWNKWRSDLQNKVMKDTNIGAPKGTGFRFSFTVDKYGNMSNLNVWSTNPVYTDLAVRVIKPVLQSYQHQPILKFPAGTKRTITNVTGGFVMSDYTQYSKPSDYSDVEKVKLKY